MEITGPFNLAAGTEIPVTPPSGSTRFTRVVLANASPFACRVNSGGVQQWLQPWSADVYPSDGGNAAYVTPAFSTAIASTNAQITASWYLDTDTISGIYPVSLPAQAVTAAITNTPTFQLQAGASVSISGTPTVDIGGAVTVDSITAGNVTVAGSVTAYTPNDVLLTAAGETLPASSSPLTIPITVPPGIQSVVVALAPNGTVTGSPTVQATSAQGMGVWTDFGPLSTGVTTLLYVDVPSGQNQNLVLTCTASIPINVTAFIYGYPEPAAQVAPVGHFIGKQSAPLYVAQTDGAGNVIGTAAAPVPNGKGRSNSGVASRQFTTTTFQQLITPPAAGLVRIVDNIAVSAAGQITLGVNSNSGNFALNNGPLAPFSPGYVLLPGSNGLYSGISATGGAIYVAWHDEYP